MAFAVDGVSTEQMGEVFDAFFALLGTERATEVS